MQKISMKSNTKRNLAILLIACMLLTLLGGNVTALALEDSKDYAVISIERRTLGQGYLIEPTYVELQEGDTAADVLVRLLDESGYEYESTGSAAGGDFYLSSIKGADSGIVDIPDYITENGGPSNDSNDGNADDSLGEFDYSMMSGWMITVNHEMINVGSAQRPVSDGDVIRWAFTLWGYGADLGYSTGWGNDGYYSEPDRGELLSVLALVNENKDEFIKSYAEIYNQAYETSLSTNVSEADIHQMAQTLSSAYEAFLNPTVTPQPENQTVKTLDYSIEDAMNKTADYLLATITDPTCGSVGGEWAILQLARSGKITSEFKNTYLSNLSTYITNLDGVLHSKKLTEYSRVIIALTALGEDPTNFAGYNLLQPLSNQEKTVWQGINGAIYALIALDTGNYEIPVIVGTGTQTTREGLIQYILGKEITGGGWALSGTTPDPDISMMAIQGLANYYDSNTEVKEAVDRGLHVISGQQKEDGGLASWGTVNSESVSQTISALCALGIDPAKDERFIQEDGSWLLSNLFSYIVAENSGISFAHVNQTSNLMATEQAGYALVAYYRLLANKNELYDMSDVTMTPDGGSVSTQEATLILPKSVPNVKDSEFTVSIRVGSMMEGTTLMDGQLEFSPYLEVKSASMDNTVVGGALNWNSEDGILRFVVMDILNGTAITSTQSGEQDLLHITFSIKEPLPENNSLLFMIKSLRQMTDSDTIYEFIDPQGIHEVILDSLNIAATVLYQGDGSDWIPSNKKAVKVEITGYDNFTTDLGFQCDTNEYSNLYQSMDYTSYSKVATFLMIVNSEVTMEDLTNSKNYYIYDSTSMESINFADTNSDLVIDAQDALNIVRLWLRKAEVEITSKVILTYNLNADARIDSIDALSIVEYFVASKPFAIMSK